MPYGVDTDSADQLEGSSYSVAVVQFAFLVALLIYLMAKYNIFGRWPLQARVAVVGVVMCALFMLSWYMFGSVAVVMHDEFSWLSYLDQNPDLGDKTYTQVMEHYKTGKIVGRPFTQVSPPESDVLVLLKTMKGFAERCPQKTYDPNRQNLVLYRVARFDARAAEVTKLNLQLFLTAMEDDSCSVSTRTFYVFSVVDGADNPYSAYLPTAQANTAVLQWHGEHEGEELYRQTRTMEVIGPDALAYFGAIFLLNSRLRGPLGGRRNGDWIQTYRALLDQNNVAIVSPVISCDENEPHEAAIHMYAIAIRSAFAIGVLEEFKVTKYTPSSQKARFLGEVTKLYNIRPNSLSVKLGYRAASLVQHKLGGGMYYNKQCTAKSSKKDVKYQEFYQSESWCEMDLQDHIFVPWGAVHVRAREYSCPNAYNSMRKYLVRFVKLNTVETQTIEAAIGKIDLFETPTVDSLRDLYRQYTEEERREHQALALHPLGSPILGGGSNSSSSTSGTVAENSQVCFLVRTSSMHDSVTHAATDGVYTEMDIFGFITSLLKQTDPNWRAYLFLTDDKPFVERLKSIVEHFRDQRVVYFDVNKEHRPVFTKVDGGYTATDYVLRQVREDKACRWLSVTNGDNAYGSEVVQRVLQYTGMQEGHHQAVPQMLLAPLDSRNFGALDYALRHGIRAERKEACKGINAMLAFNQLAYTAQPVPVVSRVDLAAIFLHRQAFRDTNILFANFSASKRYPCQGCQDGYLAEHLYSKLPGWKYARLPLDGLRSIVFHGPSPTLCIAAGNVWYDYPAVNKVGCYTRQTVHHFRLKDRQQHSKEKLYDWKHFDTTLGVCLRLTEYGFAQVPIQDKYSREVPKQTNFVYKLLGY